MAGNLTLPIEMLVNVDVDYQPSFLSKENFNRLCVIGSSANTRGTDTGVYASLDGVAQHYDETTAEYKIAKNLFSQIPRPRNIMIATVADIDYPIVP